METDKILLHEMDTLRQELRHLKDCQVRYFLLSITTTLAVIGFGCKTGSASEFIFLAPLIVILPCWWTFFDKASSITRIVGYYRILEKMMTGESAYRYYQYYGWERSLSKFRDLQNKGALTYLKKDNRPLWHDIFLLLSARTSHKYWVFNWYTFLSLSTLCVILGAITKFHLVMLIFSLLIVIISAAANLKNLTDLVCGRLSYDSNEDFWNQILGKLTNEP